MTMLPTVCVDLDGVLAEYRGWKGIGHHRHRNGMAFTGSSQDGKPIASAYVDDRAVSCAPMRYGVGEFELAMDDVKELLEPVADEAAK